MLYVCKWLSLFFLSLSLHVRVYVREHFYTGEEEHMKGELILS